MNQESRILNGKPSHQFARYVSFNVLSMLGLSLYVLADTFFIANGVGSHGLTALNLVLPVYSFFNGIGLMLGMGGATRYSVAVGEGDRQRGSTIFTQVITIGVIAGAVITVIGVLFSDQIVVLLGATEDIAPLASLYIRTILSFSLAFVVNNIFVCFVRNDGAPQLSMVAMLTASMSNILLDFVFVYPLGMGMFGAAFATGLSPVISLCVLSLHRIQKKNRFHFVRGFHNKKEVGRSLAAGLPSFVTEFSSGVVMFLFNMTLLRMAGNTAVAAYGIITNIALVCLALFNGIGQGIQPIVSVYYGAGKEKRGFKIYRYACILALVFGGVFLAAGLLFPHAITAAFNGEQNLALEAMAVRGIRLYFFAFVFMGINIVTASFLACVSKAKAAFAISFSRGIAAVLPAVLLLPLLLGMDGVWIAMPAAEAAALIISVIFVINYKKQSKLVYI